MAQPLPELNICLRSPPATPPKKPASPYTIGSRFLAQGHLLSPNDCTRDLQDRRSSGDSLKNASQLEWCLSHPPDTGGTLTSTYRDIEIEQTIRTGDDCGAQIVLVNGLVAKIYDPLFYQFHFDYDWAPPKHPQKRNVTLQAGEEYIGETAAYIALTEASYGGSIAPVYHGSWVINVPVDLDGKKCSRPVHLILIEHVVGTTLLNINPPDITQAEQENIMRKVIEAETDLIIARISHADFEPRNIIVSPCSTSSSDEDGSTDSTTFADPDLRVCIVDFASCQVFPPRAGKTFKKRNPLFRWINNDIWSDYGWLPPSEEAGQWMWRMWGDGDKDGKYVAVKEGPSRHKVLLREADLAGKECETVLRED